MAAKDPEDSDSDIGAMMVDVDPMAVERELRVASLQKRRRQDVVHPKPPGPQNLEQILGWGLDFAGRLERFDMLSQKGLVERARNLLAVGVLMTTSYSGKGTAEFAASVVASSFLGASASRGGGEGAETGVPGVIQHSSCDVDELCRKVLLGHGSGSASSHIFGDILDRLPEDVFTELRHMFQRSVQRCRYQVKNLSGQAASELKREHGNALLKEMLAKLRNVRFGTTAYCYRHHCDCPIIPYDDPELQRKYGAEVLRAMPWVDVSGTTCVAWSSSGKGEGWCHESCLPALVWAASLRYYGADAVLHECTQRFDHEVLQQLFGDTEATCRVARMGGELQAPLRRLGTSVQALMFSPVDLGVPTSRTRRYTLFSTRPMVQGLGPDDFSTCFFRETVCAASVYLRATPNQLRKHVESIAAQKDLVIASSSEGLASSDVLGASRRVRLQGFMRLAKEANLLGRASSLIVNLEQSPSFQKYVPVDNAPNLLRKSCLYDLVSQREVLPDEHFLVQGLPLPGYVSESFSAAFPFPSVLAELCDKEKRQLTGNGMHTHAVGSALIWLMASIQWEAD